MRLYDVECIDEEVKLYMYGDAEFAVVMGDEIEADDELEDSDDVFCITLQQGDKLKVEWVGMELIDGIIVNCLDITQEFGPLPVSELRAEYGGWIRSDRLRLRDGTQNGLRISRIQEEHDTPPEDEEYSE